MNVNQWYNLKYILDKLGDKKTLLTGAKVSFNVKDRVIFKYSGQDRKVIERSNGQGVFYIDKHGSGKHEEHYEAVRFPDGSKVGGYWYSLKHLDHWKVYIDEDTFARVFIAIFKGEQDE